LKKCRRVIDGIKICIPEKRRSINRHVGLSEKKIRYVKKNLSLRQRNFDNDILGYRLPVFHGEGKKVYVDFYAFDPARDELRRKKIHLDKIKSKIAQKRHASLLIHTLTQKLLSGWNPWCDVSTSRGYTSIDTIIENSLAALG